MSYPAGLGKLSPRQLEGRGARASEKPLSAPPAPPWPFLLLPVGSAGRAGGSARGDERRGPSRGGARPGSFGLQGPNRSGGRLSPPGPPGPGLSPGFRPERRPSFWPNRPGLTSLQLPCPPVPAQPHRPSLAWPGALRDPQAPDCGSRPGTRRLGTGRADTRRRRCRGRHFASNGLLQPPALRGQPDGKFMPRRRGCRGGAAAAVGARSGRRVLRRLPGPRPWGVSGRTD